MKVGPKYKICRRLGSSVYTKCQTQKYALNEEKKRPQRGRRRNNSNYATQLLEKQRTRFTYGVTERQFRRYVRESLKGSSGSPANSLFQRLEERLDNVVFSLGYAQSRRMARQLVSHGHFRVNGRRMTIPSYQVKEGDKIELRDRSRDMIFANDEGAIAAIPVWLDQDKGKHTSTVTGRPNYDAAELPFDLTKVVEFYSR